MRATDAVSARRCVSVLSVSVNECLDTSSLQRKAGLSTARALLSSQHQQSRTVPQEYDSVKVGWAWGMFYKWLAVIIVMICIIPFECTVAFHLANGARAPAPTAAALAADACLSGLKAPCINHSFISSKSVITLISNSFPKLKSK